MPFFPLLALPCLPRLRSLPLDVLAAHHSCISHLLFLPAFYRIACILKILFERPVLCEQTRYCAVPADAMYAFTPHGGASTAGVDRRRLRRSGIAAAPIFTKPSRHAHHDISAWLLRTTAATFSLAFSLLGIISIATFAHMVRIVAVR